MDKANTRLVMSTQGKQLMGTLYKRKSSLAIRMEKEAAEAVAAAVASATSPPGHSPTKLDAVDEGGCLQDDIATDDVHSQIRSLKAALQRLEVQVQRQPLAAATANAGESKRDGPKPVRSGPGSKSRRTRSQPHIGIDPRDNTHTPPPRRGKQKSRVQELRGTPKAVYDASPFQKTATARTAEVRRQHCQRLSPRPPSTCPFRLNLLQTTVPPVSFWEFATGDIGLDAGRLLLPIVCTVYAMNVELRVCTNLNLFAHLHSVHS